MLVVQPPTTGDKLCALARDAPPESHQKRATNKEDKTYTQLALRAKHGVLAFFQPVDDFWPRECATWPFQSFATSHVWRRHIAIAVDAFIASRGRVGSAVVSLPVICTKSKSRTLFYRPRTFRTSFVASLSPFSAQNLRQQQAKHQQTPAPGRRMSDSVR